MQKALIAPIVAMIALVIQLVFGVRLAEDQVEIITNGVVAFSLALVVILGFFKKKEEK